MYISVSYIWKRRNNHFSARSSLRFLALDSRRVSTFVTDKRTIIDIYVRYRLSVSKINT